MQELRLFFLQYREEGKIKYLSLGSYPSTTISNAREKARLARSQIGGGIDPKTSLPMGEPLKGTFKQLVDNYISHPDLCACQNASVRMTRASMVHMYR